MFFNFYKKLFTQYILSLSGGSKSSSSSSFSTSSSFQGIKDPFVRDAINSIIAFEGVTPKLQEQLDNRRAVADKSGAAAERFSFSNFKDLTDTAVQQLVRKQNEANKPIISKAVEGAGVSGDALSALLTNDLNARTAEAGAGLLAKIFTDVGKLETENLRTEAGLSTIDATGINALLSAIDSSKIGESTSLGTGKSSSSEFNAAILWG